MGWTRVALFPATAEDPAQLHQQAVSLARTGNYPQALTLLEQLRKEHPTNRPVLHDYIVILSWAGKDEQALGQLEQLEQLERLNRETPGEDIPAYVLSAAAQSARRLKQYDRAIDLYRRILGKQPDNLPARIGISLNLAEKGDLDTALEQLIALKELHPRDIETLFALAYIYQLRQEFFQQMVCYQNILEIEPANLPARQGLVLAISTIGAPNLALDMLEKESDLELPTDALEQIKGDRAAQLIQWGELAPETPAQRYVETDAALLMLMENARRTAKLTTDQETPHRLFRRALLDRLIALRDRVKMKEAIELYKELNRLKIPIPYYSLIQVADAYLYQNRPRTAKKLYQTALEEKEDHFNTRHSLFYAYLESENYRLAGREIQGLANDQPEWYRLKNSRVYGKNTRKLSADLTAIMFQAYSRRLHQAQKQMENKLFLAPFNRDLRTQLGKIYLWRGWPRKALKLFNLVLAQEPPHQEALIWKLHALMEYNKPELAASGIKQLRELYPENKGVQKLARDWETRRMWHFHSEMRSGRGEGLVIGNRDFYIENYLYTPPLSHWFRGFIHYHSHWAKFFGESAHHQRWGAGIDFNRGDLAGQIEILRRLTGDPDYGYRFAGQWSIDDTWELSGETIHNGLDIPLKGRVVNLKGNSTSANLVWHPSELTRFRGGYTQYDFNDGNRKNAWFLSASQRIITGPRFLLSAGGEFYASNSSLADRYYFNPEADTSILASLDAWWMNYQFYDFKFVQRLVLDYGIYRQKHYDPGWMGTIRYEHHWDFNDRQALLYGISYSRRVYDGNPEYGTTFYVTVNWRF